MPLTEVQDLVDTRLAQKISPGPRRRPGQPRGGQQPGVRIQANPTALAAYGLNIDDLRTDDRQRQRQHAQGQLRRPDARLHHQRQRPAHRSASCSRTSSSPTATARRCGSARRRRRVEEAPENTRLAAWMNTTPGGHPQRAAPARRQRHRDGRRIKALLPELRGDAAGLARRRRADRPHHHHPRLGARRADRAALRRGPGGAGDLPVPAQLRAPR